jgi:YHS domain-containing protein
MKSNKVIAACGCKACVNQNNPLISQSYRGKILYFCNKDCLNEFDDNPEKFLNSDHFKRSFEKLDNVTD